MSGSVWLEPKALSLVRNPPFVDGNRYAAFLACAVLLEINGLRMIAVECGGGVLMPQGSPRFRENR